MTRFAAGSTDDDTKQKMALNKYIICLYRDVVHAKVEEVWLATSVISQGSL